MKTPYFLFVRRNLLFPSLLVLVGITVTTAQPGQKSRAAPPERTGPARFGPGYERLIGVLTDEQRASLQEAIESQREKARDLEQRLRTARRELLETGLAGKFDEPLVRRRALAVAQLEAELTVARFKAFSQMRPSLSGEQINKLANTPGLADEGREERPRPRQDVPPAENRLPPKDRVPPEPGKTP